MSESRTMPRAREHASMTDLDELKGLMDKANEYSIDHSGLPQWTVMDVAYGGLQDQIEKDQCYVKRDENGNVSSTISLSDTDEFWGSGNDDGRALYFMKLMKDPAKASPGEGLELLTFAARETINRQKSLLRCDTVGELGGLIDYYSRLGFKNMGKFVYESSGRPGVLLEAHATDILLLANWRSSGGF